MLYLIPVPLKQAEVKFEGLRSLNIVVPEDPHNQTEK
jgi:hypothetical protein